MSYSILQYTPSERLWKLLHDQNDDYIYEILSKHLRMTLDELKVSYKVSCSYSRQRIFILGSYENIFQLFQYSQQLGVKFESITEDCLRVDMNEFINKFK